MTRAAEPDDPLWTFAVALYGRPGIEPACLLLQNRLGADVNLLLAGAWAGAAHGRRLDADACRRLAEAAGPWHREVVRPLRAARQALKPDHPGVADPARLGLRERVKAAELDAERLELLLLSAALAHNPPAGASPDAAGAVAANLRELLPPGATIDEDTRAALAGIARAAAGMARQGGAG